MTQYYQRRLVASYESSGKAHAAQEALDLVASRHDAAHTDSHINEEQEESTAKILHYTAAFSSKKKATKFMSSDFVKHFEDYKLALLKDRQSRDILLLVGAAVETLEEFPELSQEVIVLPETSEQKGNLCFFVRSKETYDVFVDVLVKILAEQERPRCNNSTAKLMQSYGIKLG